MNALRLIPLLAPASAEGARAPIGALAWEGAACRLLPARGHEALHAEADRFRPGLGVTELGGGGEGRRLLRWREGGRGAPYLAG